MTRESPGIDRVGGPGDLGCGGGLPYLDYDERIWSSRLDSFFTILIYLSQEPREKRSVIRRWCSQGLHLLRLKCSQSAWDPVELELPLRMAVVA